MADSASVTPALQRGLSRLRRMPSCGVEDAAQFDSATRKWAVPIVLDISGSSEFIPRRSRWFVLVDDTYPFGQVDLYPSAADGITATFPHQARNDRGPVDRSWGGGKLCLDSPIGGERWSGAPRDPIGNSEERLAWYAQRAVEWLEAAVAGTLTARGDPFELPWLNTADAPTGLAPRIVYDESQDSFGLWQSTASRFGTATLGLIPEIDGPLAVARLLDGEGRSVRSWSGRAIKEVTDGPLAFWWRWPAPVVLPPWQAPRTWGELWRAGRAQGVDVGSVLREVARRARGSNQRAVLLVGYPIPVRFGDDPAEFHWDAIVLPLLPAASKPASGFRPNALGRWMHDRHTVFSDNTEMVYLPTENWSEARLRARGGLPTATRNTNVALIGIGALGSVLADLLVRTGVKRLALLDSDKFIAGNICRHTATLQDIGTSKVDVARRLMQISPHVEIVAHRDGLPASPEAAQHLLQEYDAIIDCTASNDVLATLGRAWWEMPRLMLSVAVGYAARRVFVFSAFGNQFPEIAFHEQLQPWLSREALAWAAHGELLEGAGCWSPLFPARHDDLVLAAAVCLKEFERCVAKWPGQPVLDVFEQVSDDAGFQSFCRVAHPADATGPQR